MNQEERKLYNESYYQRNRERILQRCQQKTQCNLCNRTISITRIAKHATGKLCFNRQLQAAKIKKQNDEIQAIITGLVPEPNQEKKIPVDKQKSSVKRPRGRPKKVAASNELVSVLPPTEHDDNIITN